MSVMQNSSMKVLWNLADRHLSHNHPDIASACVDFIKNHCLWTDVAIPGDSFYILKLS